MSSVNLDQKDITGIVPKEERKSMATAISSSSVIDPLAFQMMIVGTIIAISHILREAIIKVFPFWSKIPLHHVPDHGCDYWYCFKQDKI